MSKRTGNNNQTEQEDLDTIRQHWGSLPDEDLWLDLSKSDTRTVDEMLLDEISRQGELHRRGLLPPYRGNIV